LAELSLSEALLILYGMEEDFGARFLPLYGFLKDPE